MKMPRHTTQWKIERCRLSLTPPTLTHSSSLPITNPWGRCTSRKASIVKIGLLNLSETVRLTKGLLVFSLIIINPILSNSLVILINTSPASPLLISLISTWSMETSLNLWQSLKGPLAELCRWEINLKVFIKYVKSEIELIFDYRKLLKS